jgi:hypothetical protein
MKFRRPRKTIAAAVRVEPELYEFACRKVESEDSNFSRYVRELIRRDLMVAGVLMPTGRTK